MSKQHREHSGLPRRSVLRTVAATGVLAGVSGLASANGQGGQCVVRSEDYDERTGNGFIIYEVPDAYCADFDGDGNADKDPDGSCEATPQRLFFSCEGEGGRFPPGKDGGLPFPFWFYRYLDDNGDPVGPFRKLFTRDNKVKTGIEYRFNGSGAKTCLVEDPNGPFPAGIGEGDEPREYRQTGFSQQ